MRWMGHVRWRWLTVASATAALALVAASCDDGGGGGGGVTIPQNDSTPPELTLQVSETTPGSQTVSVTTTGGNQNLALQQATGTLNLVATAKDPQSGIQDTQIFLGKSSSSCDPVSCSQSGPGLQVNMPKFSSPSPKKNPGDTTAASSILAQSLDLATELGPVGPPLPPGNSASRTLHLAARAFNHLNGQSNTFEVQATFSRP